MQYGELTDTQKEQVQQLFDFVDPRAYLYDIGGGMVQGAREIELRVYYPVVCSVCGQGMSEDEEAHWGHESECLASTNPDEWEGCECDLYHHPRCCPDAHCDRGVGEDDPKVTRKGEWISL